MNVELRTPTYTDDITDAALLIVYPDVSSLDPPVQRGRNPIKFSIFADNIYVGRCELYNREGTSIELGIRLSNQPYWNKGIGTKAVNALLCIAKRDGISHVKLQTLSTNNRAIRCYQKCGFIICGSRTLSGYDFVLMEKVYESK